jgi:hypothetical protein
MEFIAVIDDPSYDQDGGVDARPPVPAEVEV